MSQWVQQAKRMERGERNEPPKRKPRQPLVEDRFLSAVWHDLRGPLGAIANWVHVLEVDGDDPRKREEAIEAIRRSLRHQGQRLDDLVDLWHIDAGTFVVVRQPLDLLRIVEGATREASAPAEAKGLALSIARSGNSAWVQGDPQRLHRTFSHLLSNALRYTPRGGRIEVRVELAADGEAWEVRVTDTGPGLPPERRATLWGSGPAARADGAAQRRSGLGVGLRLVRHIVEGHGGTVAIESAGDGAGTTAVVRLPSSRLPSSASAAPATSPLQSS
jgi:signal transduction histidine kinase